MLRRHIASPLLAPFIPRSVWDVAHANPNWTDSYATDIADRRHWPARRWSIGLEPRTPREWLKFSHRNLAYAYNGAMRACDNFPEMLTYYKEMKVRGVKVDVDTMNLLLSRAARFEGMRVDDIFLLFDELVSLGARADVASVEILQTVLEHCAHQPHAWREAKRRQLMEWYNALALEEVERLRGRQLEALLIAQLARLRRNVRQLHARLSPRVYMVYFSALDSAEQLLREVHHYLWDFVDPDHPATELPLLNMRIPCITTVLRRPKTRLCVDVMRMRRNAQTQTASSVRLSRKDGKDEKEVSVVETVRHTDFEDGQVCAVLLAALERSIDRDFSDRARYSERRVYLGLLTMMVSSGVMYTSHLMAQLMDCVKYSREVRSRDRDAVRLLRYALRVTAARVADAEPSSSSSSFSVSSRALEEVERAPGATGGTVAGVLTRGQLECWSDLAPVVDGRVVGRYVASRDAWSELRLCFDGSSLQFGTYPITPLLLANSTNITNNNSNNNSHGNCSDDNTVDSSSSGKIQRDDGNNNSKEDAGSSRGDGAIDSVTDTRVTSIKSSEAFQRRWRDILTLIEQTGVLRQYRRPRSPDISAPSLSTTPASCAMEVFTGMMAFLRNTITGQRYGSLEEAWATQVVGDKASPSAQSTSESGRMNTMPLFDAELTLPVCQTILSCLEEARFMMERFMEEFNTHLAHVGSAEVRPTREAEKSRLGGHVWTGSEKEGYVESEHAVRVALSNARAEPEFECWEAMLVVLRSIMDFCVVQKQQQQMQMQMALSSSKESGDAVCEEGEGAADRVREVDRLFQRASRLRTQLVLESKTRFDGRMRILWLHEA